MIYDTYNNLKREKNILELRIEDYQEEKKKLRKLAKVDGPADMQAIDYSSTPVQATSQIDFAYYLSRTNEIDNHLILHKARLEKVEELMKKIEEELKQLVGNYYEVAYKRFVEGKTFKKIAEEMNYSKRRIEQLVAEIKKDFGEISQTSC